MCLSFDPVTLHKPRDLMGSFEMWWFVWLWWEAWQVSSHFIFTRFLWGRFYYLHFMGVEAEVQRREVPHPNSQSHEAAESRSNWSSLPSLVLMLVPTLLSAQEGNCSEWPRANAGPSVGEALRKVLHVPEVQSQSVFSQTSVENVNVKWNVFPLINGSGWNCSSYFGGLSATQESVSRKRSHGVKEEAERKVHDLVWQYRQWPFI